jgi:hypothetical protein
MLSNVSTWGHMQYFVLVLPCHSNHRFVFSQPHEDALTPGPPKQMKCNVTHNNYNALVYITNR